MADILARALADRNHHLAEAAKLQELVDIYRRYEAEEAAEESEPAPGPEPMTNEERVAGWRALWAPFPIQDPVANVEEGATGAIAAVSNDPASRETDDADRQQLAASGFSGEAAAEAHHAPIAAAPVPPQPDLPAETEQAGAGDSVAPADHIPVTDKPAEAAASVAPATLKERIIALRAEHPEWTLDQAARHLRAPRNSVQSYASILKFKWPRPPVVKKEPRFLLRNSFGEYLHRNQSTVTRLPKFYGHWTQAECDEIKAKGGKFAELTERPAP